MNKRDLQDLLRYTSIKGIFHYRLYITMYVFVTALRHCKKRDLKAALLLLILLCNRLTFTNGTKLIWIDMADR